MDDLIKLLDPDNIKESIWQFLFALYVIKDLGTKVIEIIKTKQEIKLTKEEGIKNTNINTQILEKIKKISQRYDNNMPEQITKKLIFFAFHYVFLTLFFYISENKTTIDKAKIIQKIKDLEFELINEFDDIYYKSIKLSEYVDNSFIDANKLIDCLTNLSVMNDIQIKECINTSVNNSLQAVIKKIIK